MEPDDSGQQVRHDELSPTSGTDADRWHRSERPGGSPVLRISPTARTAARLVLSFAERETKSLYKRSVLGWLWSLLKPLTTVAVYGLVFGVIYRATPPATANGRAEVFALYLFSGLVVWNVFQTVVSGAMRWMDGVSELRKKIYFPTETALVGGAASTLLQGSLEALVLVVIMASLANVSWTLVFLPVAIVLVALFALGLGFAAAIINARYRDIQHLTGIVLSVGFFMVPIVYTPDIVPDRAYGLPVARIVELNPLNSVVAVARDAVYFLEVPAAADLVTAAAWAFATFTLGLIYFRRRSMAISEEP